MQSRERGSLQSPIHHLFMAESSLSVDHRAKNKPILRRTLKTRGKTDEKRDEKRYNDIKGNKSEK